MSAGVRDVLPLSRVFAETMAGLAAPRRVFPIAVVVLPLLALQRSFSLDALALPVGAGHRGGVELSVHADAATLVIELVNPGAYRGPREGGSGLPMVEKRLHLAYGDRASFAIGADGDHRDRTRVTVRMPRSLEARS